VWQGSDFELDAALSEQRDQLGRIELANLLNERQVIEPMVARRYAIETGTLRYFHTRFADNVSAIAMIEVDSPTVVLCLAETRDIEDQFFEACRNATLNARIIVGVVANARTIREAVSEVIAYERVQRNYPEVNSDPIALRELKDRMAMAREVEHELLSSVLEEPESSVWWWMGRDFRLNSKRGLQELLSRALEHTFAKAPLIANELINRDRPSSTANAARKKLLMAMLDAADQADLGIEKFPAEKAMYRALLLSTGVHREVGETWQFVPPLDDSRGNMAAVWTAIDQKLAECGTQPMPISNIYEHLLMPPYGVKLGVLPILFFAYYLSNEDELALFDDGRYCPFVTPEVIERILRDPRSFSLQLFRLDDTRDNIYRAYIEAASTLGESPSHVSLVVAAKELSRFMMKLPDCAKLTKTISIEAQGLRDRFFTAKSPSQLMFFQIPDVFGLPPLVGEVGNVQDLNKFRAKLQAAISDLRVAYHALLNDFIDQLREAFKLSRNDDLQRIRELIAGRYSGLQDYTIDVQGLKAFIGRLVDNYGDETQWMISLAGFLARKPPEKWTDDDASAAKFRLYELAKKVRELETLRIHSERADDSHRDYELILLRCVSHQNGESELVVRLDNEKRAMLSKLIESFEVELQRLDNEDLRSAVLAMLVGAAAKREQQLKNEALPKVIANEK
jgi:hypothetical protein